MVTDTLSIVCEKLNTGVSNNPPIIKIFFMDMLFYEGTAELLLPCLWLKDY
jgi:hypothetical protein